MSTLCHLTLSREMSGLGMMTNRVLGKEASDLIGAMKAKCFAFFLEIMTKRLTNKNQPTNRQSGGFLGWLHLVLLFFF